MTPTAQVGAGFKARHASEILGARSGVGFFEVHAENYMGAGGPPHAQLARLRAAYPLSVHGVGMSIGGAGPLDEDHLARLKAVVDRYEPALVSEHLAWSSHRDGFLNDLLAVPYTNEVLAGVARHIDRVQEVLGRRILLENPATYVCFEASTWEETDFIREVQRRTGCGLLLDINNVQVSAVNHGFDPSGYLRRFPVQAVREIHLAGSAESVDDQGQPFLIDAHDRAPSAAVIALYADALRLTGPVPTLIEWDNDVPAWSVLVAEAARAAAIMTAVIADGSERHVA